jgi:hypothetical protein
MLLGMMLRTERHLATAIYFSAASLPLRLEFVRSVAKSALPSATATQLQELLEDVRKRSLERNKVVHCEWATATEYPDALIRVEPATYHAAWMREYEIAAALHSQRVKDGKRTDDVRTAPIREGLGVYKEHDFRDIIDRLESLFRGLCSFAIRWLDDRSIQSVSNSGGDPESCE